MSEPREFWLIEYKEYGQWSAHDSEHYDTDIHVIEYSAYDLKQKQLERAIEALGKIAKREYSMAEQALKDIEDMNNHE